MVEICKCNGWEIWRNQHWSKRQAIPTDSQGGTDEDGFHLCPFCKKYAWANELTQCDICDNYFKGVKKFPKFGYTCPDCEAKL